MAELDDYNLEVLELPYYPGTERGQAETLNACFEQYGGKIDALLDVYKRQEFYAGHPVPGRAPFEPDGPLGGEDAEAFSFQAQDILILSLIHI